MKKTKKEDSAFYSAVMVFSSDLEQTLLAKRKDDDTWTSPAGGSNFGETPKQTAIREVFEEANLLLKEEDLEEFHVKHLQNGKVCHCFMTRLRNIPKDLTPKNDADKEVRKWKWFKLDEKLPEPMEPNRQETMNMAIKKITEDKKTKSIKERWNKAYEKLTDPKNRPDLETWKNSLNDKQKVSAYYGNYKAFSKAVKELNDLIKGGEGSGKEGHTTEHLKELMRQNETAVEARNQLGNHMNDLNSKIKEEKDKSKIKELTAKQDSVALERRKHADHIEHLSNKIHEMGQEVNPHVPNFEDNPENTDFTATVKMNKSKEVASLEALNQTLKSLL